MKTVAVDSNHRTNFFILGIFFLVWSINGFFIGGNLLKMVLLMLGFGLIIVSCLTLPKNRKFIRFAILSLFILVIYWIVAILNNQQTTAITTIVFDVICYLLLLSGYLTANNIKINRQLSPWVISAIAVLTILGGIIFIKFQSQLLLNSTEGISSRMAVEEGDESGINVIGIAYTNAIIFFILYCFIVYYDVRNWIKVLTVVGLFTTLFVILTTESRGALVFIFFIIVLINIKKIVSIRNFFKLIPLVTVAIILFVAAVNYFPSIQEKLDGTLSRFESLLKAKQDIRKDESSYERTLVIKDFIDNIEDVVFFGKERYVPYPHNQFIEIIMRWGIFLGLPLMFIAIRSFLKGFVKLYKGGWQSPIANLLAFLFIFAFLQSLTSMSLEMNRMYWLGLGFLVAIPSKEVIDN